MDFVATWSFLTTYPALLAGLITFVSTALWSIINRVLAARPRLTWGTTNQTTFLVPAVPAPMGENGEPPPPAVPSLYRAQNIWVQNHGNAIAEEVEIVFNFPPQHIQHYPNIPATIQTLPDGRWAMTFARINPREAFTISMLSLNAEHPLINLLRCKGFGAKQVPFGVQRTYPKWFLLLVGLDMLLGLAAAVYLVLIAALWVAHH